MPSRFYGMLVLWAAVGNRVKKHTLHTCTYTNTHSMRDGIDDRGDDLDSVDSARDVVLSKKQPRNTTATTDAAGAVGSGTEGIGAGSTTNTGTPTVTPSSSTTHSDSLHHTKMDLTISRPSSSSLAVTI